MSDAPHQFKPEAVDEDECADCRPSWEQCLLQLIAEDDYISPLLIIKLVEPASFFEGEKADVVQLRLGAQDFSAASSELAYFVQITTRNNRSGSADVRGFTDVEIIGVGQQISAGGVHVALNRRRTPWEKKHDVFAEFGHLSLIAGAEAFADAYQQQQRSHSPCNSKHGKE